MPIRRRTRKLFVRRRRAAGGRRFYGKRRRMASSAFGTVRIAHSRLARPRVYRVARRRLLRRNQWQPITAGWGVGVPTGVVSRRNYGSSAARGGAGGHVRRGGRGGPHGRRRPGEVLQANPSLDEKHRAPPLPPLPNTWQSQSAFRRWLVASNKQREVNRLYDDPLTVGAHFRSIGIPFDPFGVDWNPHGEIPSGATRGSPAYRHFVAMRPGMQQIANATVARAQRLMQKSDTVRQAFASGKRAIGSFGQRIFDAIIDRVPGGTYLNKQDRDAIWHWLSVAAGERVYDPLVEWLTGRA